MGGAGARGGGRLLLASGGRDNLVSVTDLRMVGKATSSFQLQGHTDWVTSVGLSGDGCRLVSGSRDGTCRAWNMEADKAQAQPAGQEMLLRLQHMMP